MLHNFTWWQLLSLSWWPTSARFGLLIMWRGPLNNLMGNVCHKQKYSGKYTNFNVFLLKILSELNLKRLLSDYSTEIDSMFTVFQQSYTGKEKQWLQCWKLHKNDWSWSHSCSSTRSVGIAAVIVAPCSWT